MREEKKERLLSWKVSEREKKRETREKKRGDSPTEK